MPSPAGPIVGLTLDTAPPTGISKVGRYLIRANYCAAVAQAGGIPFALPHEADLAEAYAERIDALVVTGGGFDIDPKLFGAETRHATVTLKEDRTRFEWAITKAMLDRDKPVLGICGGQQLLNVMLGGTLIQHIEDEIAGGLLHEQPNPRTEPGHMVRVTPGTLLHRLTGATEIAVNSAHHQAVKAVGPQVAVNAVAPDGVIEGIESRIHRFCLGVQWHPEFQITGSDTELFSGLVAAARA
jgi:putative glutamine amidotransferase